LQRDASFEKELLERLIVTRAGAANTKIKEKEQQRRVVERKRRRRKFLR